MLNISHVSAYVFGYVLTVTGLNTQLLQFMNYNRCACLCKSVNKSVYTTVINFFYYFFKFFYLQI